MIIIPSKVDFGTLDRTMPAQSKDFSVGITNAVFEDNGRVTVGVTSDFQMAAGSNSLAYSLFNVKSGGTALLTGQDYCTFLGSDPLILDDLAHAVDGRVTCNPAQILKAGAYIGTMVFNITYTTAA
jgi:hypothetical protein